MENLLCVWGGGSLSPSDGDMLVCMNVHSRAPRVRSVCRELFDPVVRRAFSFQHNQLFSCNTLKICFPQEALFPKSRNRLEKDKKLAEQFENAKQCANVPRFCFSIDCHKHKKTSDPGRFAKTGLTSRSKAKRWI